MLRNPASKGVPVRSTVASYVNMDRSSRELAVTLLRVALGVNFLGHGVSRILRGWGAFAAATATHMTKSPLPPGMLVAFGYCIPWIELLLGLGLVLGL